MADLAQLPAAYRSAAEKYVPGKSMLEVFLDKRYAKRGWIWAKPPLAIKIAKIADNPSSVPKKIGAVSAKVLGKYRSITVYKQSWINIVEFFRPEEFERYLPKKPWHRSILVRYDQKIGKVTRNHRFIEEIASFSITQPVVPQVRLRFRAVGERQVWPFAVFTPVDKGLKVEVVRAKGMTKIGGCGATYFVRGKMLE